MPWLTPGRTLDLTVGKLKVAVNADGGVTFVHEHGLLLTNVSELLYIVQQYQAHNGGTMSLKVDVNDWGTLVGKPA